MDAAVKSGTPKNGVQYTFEGEYYARAGKEQLIKDYKLDVVFAESHPGALSIFRKCLHDTSSNIYKLMFKKYPDYVRFRTHTITAELNLTNPNKSPKAIDRMNKKQLAKYISENDIKIDATLFGDDIGALRQAIADYENNPETFAEKYEEFKKGVEMVQTLNNLNPVDSDVATTPAEPPNADDLLDDLDVNENDEEIDLEDAN